MLLLFPPAQGLYVMAVVMPVKIFLFLVFDPQWDEQEMAAVGRQ